MPFSVAEQVSFKENQSKQPEVYNASATTHDFILLPKVRTTMSFVVHFGTKIIKSSTLKAKPLFFTFQSVKRDQHNASLVYFFS